MHAPSANFLKLMESPSPSAAAAGRAPSLRIVIPVQTADECPSVYPWSVDRNRCERYLMSPTCVGNAERRELRLEADQENGVLDQHEGVTPDGTVRAAVPS